MNTLAENNTSAWSRIKAIQAPWVWSFIGAVLVWLAIVAIFGFGIASNVAQTALTYGVFMVLVGLGQMLVITSGVGNIDLSVPSTIALAGVVGMHT
ncbi:MAG: ABC transporter permease, partial [Paraburkholderia caledonica]